MQVENQIRKVIQASQRQRLSRHLTQFSDTALASSAVVFAPHPDDETLGCGGTILRKRQLGAEVHIAIMADGRSSHGHLIAADDLTAMREGEAEAAARALGVERSHLHFFRFPDGSLTNCQTEAAQQVQGWLKKISFSQVFIPLFADQNADHIATNRIVLAALQQLGVDVDVFEYPVWYWYYWPWVRVWQGTPRTALDVLKRTFRQWRKAQQAQFNCSIDVGQVLSAKRAALLEHASQMLPHQGRKDWQTLQSFSQGDFLACFFQEQELFRSYRVVQGYFRELAG